MSKLHHPSVAIPAASTPSGTLKRRQFLRGTAIAAAGLAATPVSVAAAGADTAESLTATLFETLSPRQREVMCFDWNHRDKKRGLLRTFVANNWNVTRAEINSDFYRDDQRAIIRDIFEAMIHPSWHDRYDTQLEDDMGGFGYDQSIAIFGQPNRTDKPFQLVLTGRHMTLRCDGNSADHVAFGGPIFYGHAADDQESASHTGNVFWSQAVAANDLFQMLDGRQRELARQPKTPRENAVAFRGSSFIPGLPVSELSSDQLTEMRRVLGVMVEPFRISDRREVTTCLQSQGGLEQCRLSFYTDRDIGDDGVWDNWRLEGPSFVWHFRGAPHVHVWVNIADSPDVPLNA